LTLTVREIPYAPRITGNQPDPTNDRIAAVTVDLATSLVAQCGQTLDHVAGWQGVVAPITAPPQIGLPNLPGGCRAFWIGLRRTWPRVPDRREVLRFAFAFVAAPRPEARQQ
jgi:hypothetical protein